jgi:hypothetical protein
MPLVSSMARDQGFPLIEERRDKVFQSKSDGPTAGMLVIPFTWEPPNGQSSNSTELLPVTSKSCMHRNVE